MTIDERSASVPGWRGPVQRAERALAPDLTRGAMLLFIALANVVGVVSEPAPGRLARGLNLLMLTLMHARAYPVFAIMFGYGLVQLARRQEAAGASPEQLRSVLLRRNAWLVGFGFLHAALLYSGDFLGAYGLVGMVATLVLLRRGERFHRAVLWLWAFSLLEALVLAGLVTMHLAHGPSELASLPGGPAASLAAPDYVTSVRLRLAEWPAHTASVLPFIIIVWLGMWAARRRLLEEEESHRRLLAWVATCGLVIAILGGLPLGLVGAGLLHADAATVKLILVLQQVSGMFGGPGYVALFGLVTLRLSRATSAPRQSPVVGALSALGQRSLSGYLFQSVAWLLLLAPYTLALGQHFASPTLTALVIAVLVWLVSLVGAYALERLALPGPAEAVLRRLTYGNRR